MYKSAKEVMEALLAGKKIRNTIWAKDTFLCMKVDKLLDHNGEESRFFQLDLYYSWEEYVEKPKKLKFYKLTNDKINEIYIVSAPSKKDARNTVVLWMNKDSNHNLYHTDDIYSIKSTSCERINIKNNVMISTTESYIDPKEIL